MDPRYYHLDTALCVLDAAADEIMYYPDAFSPGSRAVLRRLFPDALLAREADAAAFGLNSVSDGRHVLLPQAATGLNSTRCGTGASSRSRWTWVNCSRPRRQREVAAPRSCGADPVSRCTSGGQGSPQADVPRPPGYSSPWRFGDRGAGQALVAGAELQQHLALADLRPAGDPGGGRGGGGKRVATT
ncbi:hypothetical protein SMICM17S_10539 [Streptomyces microflavus]